MPGTRPGMTAENADAQFQASNAIARSSNGSLERSDAGASQNRVQRAKGRCQGHGETSDMATFNRIFTTQRLLQIIVVLSATVVMKLLV
jgi:hypothetical protein